MTGIDMYIHDLQEHCKYMDILRLTWLIEVYERIMNYCDISDLKCMMIYDI